MISFFVRCTSGTHETLAYILYCYVSAIVQDGDYLNDWRTHLPDWMRSGVEAVGYALSLALGY